MHLIWKIAVLRIRSIFFRIRIRGSGFLITDPDPDPDDPKKAGSATLENCLTIHFFRKRYSLACFLMKNLKMNKDEKMRTKLTSKTKIACIRTYYLII